MIRDSNGETNFPHKLLLTDTEVSRLRKAFENKLSATIRLSKTQLAKRVQSGKFLGRLQKPLLEAGLPLKKNILKTLAKSYLIQLGLIVSAPAAYSTRYKKSLEI